MCGINSPFKLMFAFGFISFGFINNMEKLQDTYKVVSNEKLCPRFYRLCIDAKLILKEINT